MFGKTQEQVGHEWFEYRHVGREKLSTPCSIAFAFVATHNHFTLDHGGKVFNRTAPIIKLQDGATEDDHLALLAYLNSSTACFWMKQVFFDKGNRGEGGGTTAEAWEKFFEFDGTKLRALPIPEMDKATRARAIEFARALTTTSERARSLADLRPLFEASPDVRLLDVAISSAVKLYDEAINELRAQQECLDWWVYSLMGLAPNHLAEVELVGARASDFLFAREVLAGGVGERYFSLCRLPSPAEIVSQGAPEAHLAAIAASSELAFRPTLLITPAGSLVSASALTERCPGQVLPMSLHSK